jgi:hypothetical protein
LQYREAEGPWSWRLNQRQDRLLLRSEDGRQEAYDIHEPARPVHSIADAADLDPAPAPQSPPTSGRDMMILGGILTGIGNAATEGALVSVIYGATYNGSERGTITTVSHYFGGILGGIGAVLLLIGIPTLAVGVSRSRGSSVPQASLLWKIAPVAAAQDHGLITLVRF